MEDGRVCVVQAEGRTLDMVFSNAAEVRPLLRPPFQLPAEVASKSPPTVDAVSLAQRVRRLPPHWQAKVLALVEQAETDSR